MTDYERLREGYDWRYITGWHEERQWGRVWQLSNDTSQDMRVIIAPDGRWWPESLAPAECYEPATVPPHTVGGTVEGKP